MNCTNKQQESAECEKRGCSGCFYEDKNIDEIINEVIKIKNHQIAVFEPKENIQITRNYFTEEQRNTIQSLIDLYNKEKEKNNSISIQYEKVVDKLEEYQKQLEKWKKKI